MMADESGRHLGEAVQHLHVALEVMARLAQARLLLGAANVPRDQQLKRFQRDLVRGVRGDEERVERRLLCVDKESLSLLVHSGCEAAAYLPK